MPKLRRNIDDATLFFWLLPHSSQLLVYSLSKLWTQKSPMWGVLLYRTLNYKNITLIFTIRLHSTPKCFDLKHFEKLINWLPGTVLIMMLNFWYHQRFEKFRVPIQPWHIHTAKLPVIHSVDQTIFTNSIWICINWKHFVKPCWWSNKSFEEKADWPLIFQWKGM